MSTRSEIAIQRMDGSIESVYCHSDGYLSYMGVLLNGYYNSLRKARSIINQKNDCSMLSTTIEKSRFYNSWRNENTKAKEFMNEYAFMDYFSSNVWNIFIYSRMVNGSFQNLILLIIQKITIVIALHTMKQSSFLYLRP